MNLKQTLPYTHINNQNNSIYLYITLQSLCSMHLTRSFFLHSNIFLCCCIWRKSNRHIRDNGMVCKGFERGYGMTMVQHSPSRYSILHSGFLYSLWIIALTVYLYPGVHDAFFEPLNGENVNAARYNANYVDNPRLRAWSLRMDTKGVRL